MDLKEGIQKALDGDSILFVGAGFSLDAINIRKLPLKNGAQLTQHFAKLAGISETTSIEDAAEVYQDKFGVDELINEIKSEFTVLSVSDYQEDIARIPWKRIYTTNYDNVIEKSFNNVKKQITAITIHKDISNVPKNSTMCIHLNGYAETLDRESIFSELKLTESSYITASIVDSPWATLLRQDIRLARSIFFIGYSSYDLDVKRILAQSETTKQKTFFFVGPKSSHSIKRRCSLFGSVFEEAASEFSKKVYVVSKDYQPRDEGVFSPLSVKEYEPKSLMRRITDRDFLNLLMFGKRQEDLVYESMTTQKKYYLERADTSEVFNFIDM